MSSIDAIIEYMETGRKTADCPMLYEAADNLFKHNPNFYLRFWESMMEFKVPKMVRSGYIAEMNADEKNIKIEVVHAEHSGNTTVREDKGD